MSRPHRLLVITLACILSTATLYAADEPTPEEVLKGKGLRRLSTHFSLPEETEFGKRVRAIASMKRKVLDTQRKLAVYEKNVEDKKRLLIAYLQRRRELRAQLVNARTVTAHNRLVTAINELADRVTLMETAGEEEKALKAAQVAANEVSEQYIEQVLQARTMCEQILEKYKDLAADGTVTGAIEQYNKASGKKLKLGPSTSLLSYDRRLKALEDTVLSESIPLRGGGRGQLWHLSVMFGGKYVKEFALDTGASLITLPWPMAADIGMTPGPDAPIIRLQLADGRIIEGRRMVADSVRVGKFTIEKVECAVMPKDLPNPAALLGLSFLKHFSYKIDTANSKLVMAKIQTSSSSAPKRP